jgi:hypothetical protein
MSEKQCHCGRGFFAVTRGRKLCDMCREERYQQRLAAKRTEQPWHWKNGKLVRSKTVHKRKPYIQSPDFRRALPELQAELSRVMALGLNMCILPSDRLELSTYRGKTA